MATDCTCTRLFCLTDVQSPPIELTREKNGVIFSSALELPLPKQVVVFSLGQWGQAKSTAKLGIEVTVDGSHNMNIGFLTKDSRSICWEGEWSKKLLRSADDHKSATAQITVTVPKDMVSILANGKHLVNSPGSTEKSKSTEKIPRDSIEETVAREADEEDTENMEANVQTEHNAMPLGAKKPEQVDNKKKRSRSQEKTQDGATQRKRKPNTRGRALKDVLNTEQEVLIPTSNPVAGSPIPVKKDVTKPVVVEEAPCQTHRPAPVQATSMPVEATSPGANPSARWGHTLCMVDESRAVVIGGQGDKQLARDSIWSLSINKRRWSAPETTTQVGPKPEMRMGHTAVFDPTVQSIYIYGGSKMQRWFNDVHILDIDEMKWQVVKANGKAPTRAYHSATLYRHELWIFGGVYPRPDPQPDGCSNQIHVFSPIEENWYSPIVMGEKPTPRSGHSATQIRDQLVMFGGWDAPITYSDIHVLDLVTLEWTEPKFTGKPPRPRSWHASCALSGNRLMIHGGYDGNLALEDCFIFNLDHMMWTEVTLDPVIPARVGHTALCLPYKHENEERDDVYIFGGGDNDGAFFSDLQRLLVPFGSNTGETS